MKQLSIMIFSVIFLLMIPFYVDAGEPVHHTIKAVLYPEEHHIRVVDTMTVTGTLLTGFHFYLHKGLKPSSPTNGVQIKKLTPHNKNDRADSFEVTLPAGLNTFVLEYKGSIYHELESYGKEYARGFRDTPGIISGEGIYLSGSSYWYPKIENRQITFSLHLVLPSAWDAVSQGSRIFHHKNKDTTTVTWESNTRQEGIYIVAGQFTEYTLTAGQIEAMVFLRSPDEALANNYLDATVQYIKMYEKLIGPYPYSKFALVENFWETGFGMPSFTLLGQKIIRFPFILYTSYPHEILHNWWGNSVYPDYEKGNWSEGLTAYLSDHLIKEQRGKGMKYRQTTLQKYVDYVLSGKDFPLTGFRSRHSSPSEAVGYGKSLMFFHMLRQKLGDELFIKCLQHFYRNNTFKMASFDDIRKSFEKVSEKKLKRYFDQWVERTGAPRLIIKKVKARAEGKGYVVSAEIEQAQKGKPYELNIPIALTMEDRNNAYQSVFAMKKKKLKIKIDLPARPIRLDVDPGFDIFRKLAREEIPPALSQAFGSEKLLILLPSSVKDSLVTGYQGLAESLSKAGPDEVTIRYDGKIKGLPSDRSVLLIGWENRFLDTFISAIFGYDVEIGRTSVRIALNRIPRKDHAFILTARHPKNRDLSLIWIAADTSEAIPGLGRKLPHYHKYSYLAFEGDEPSNVAKGRWPVINSPMTAFIQTKNGSVKKTEMGTLRKEKPLIELPPVFSGERMIKTVTFLAGKEFEGRGFGSVGLDRVAEFIAEQFTVSGLEPAGDTEESFFQTWSEAGGERGKKTLMKNVVGLLRGKDPDIAKQCVVVGAHYDHLGLGWPDVRKENKGKIHPGADDNASGIAVLLELARVLSKGLTPERTVIFVAFSGEEAEKRGSEYFVTHAHKDYVPSECMGMINLDTVGRLGNNKLMVLGAGSAREWTHIFRGVGYVTGVEIETVTEELDSSDQSSFHKIGVPAVQLFSGPHTDYHRPSDTADKIDVEGLEKISLVAKEVIEYLSGRPDPLTGTLKNGIIKGAGTKERRKVSLGTIPDFAFKGRGCRITGVVPGSPADSCGIQEGDIIIKINDSEINSLRDLSSVLKSLKAGDQINITVMRGKKKISAMATVVPR